MSRNQSNGRLSDFSHSLATIKLHSHKSIEMAEIKIKSLQQFFLITRFIWKLKTRSGRTGHLNARDLHFLGDPTSIPSK